MSIQKVSGLQLAIAATFGVSKTMSGVTNASTGVATLEASHGVVQGDVMIVSSGWDLLNTRVVRAGTVATNAVNLEGVDTTSTADYPTGAGAGSVMEVASWLNLTQLRPDFTVGGGGFTQDDITLMISKRKVNRPGLAEAVNLDFSSFWDPSLTWVATVRAASKGGVLTPYRMTTAGGSYIYGNAYWGFLEEPVPENNSLIYKVTLGLAVDSIAYAS